jgi:hypothetical protein
MAKTLEVFSRIKKKKPGFVIAMDIDDKKGLDLHCSHMDLVGLTMLPLGTLLRSIQLTEQIYTICRSICLLVLITTSKASYLLEFYLLKRL